MLIEIIIKNQCFDIFDRQDIEDILNEELEKNQLGSVTGGGSNLNLSNIDIEIFDMKSIDFIMRILSKFNLSKESFIKSGNEKIPIVNSFG